MQEAAGDRGGELSVQWAATLEDIGPAIEAAEKARVEGLNVLASPMFFGSRKAIYSSAARARLPAIYYRALMASEGGLIAYGPAPVFLWRQFARELVKVLNGTKPADIPVEQPAKFELVVNQDREYARAHHPTRRSRPRRRGDRMKRRDVIAGLLAAATFVRRSEPRSP